MFNGRSFYQNLLKLKALFWFFAVFSGILAAFVA